MNQLFPELMPVAGDDVAYTPDAVARACVATLPPIIGGAWEPYAGGGAFCRALVGHGAYVFASDIDPAAPALGSTLSRLADASKGWPLEGPRPDWIVSNPPFSVLDEHLPVLLATAQVGVAMLLIGQWLAPGARDWLWQGALPDEILWLRERVAFEGPGRNGKDTDSREYAWIIWRRSAERGWMGRGHVGRLSWHTGQLWAPHRMAA